MTAKQKSAVVIGAGPNGLTAAALLAEAGWKVEVLEAGDTPGGGSRTAELTLPGFRHDVCSAVHPMAFLSPAFRELNLADVGLEWVHPELSVAHPFPDGPAALLSPDLEETLASLDRPDRGPYRRMVEPLLENFEQLAGQLLQPFSWRKDIPGHLRFGLKGLQPAASFARRRFRGERARGLLAGCAAHSVLPMEAWGTTAFGLIFLLSGHRFGWPVARGGSQAIIDALCAVLRQHGGTIRCGCAVTRFDELPQADRYLFDIAPAQVNAICGDHLPSRYRRSLQNFRYGPAVFKIDYALSQPIPWKDPDCLRASTVHVGGTLDEIAASEGAPWRAEAPSKPFLIVCQQSLIDRSRAPEGKHTGYVYCHVPYGWRASELDTVERQLERFAPGFRDCVLERWVSDPVALEAYNPANRGGTITGGANTLWQLMARPALRLSPYSTPNPRIYLCSHSTPPGGGVHGMCGYNAAGFAMGGRLF